jgi:predicted RNA methylase
MRNMFDVITADCLDHMRTMPDNAVDAVVTDPPYGLTFMGKDWDKGVPGEVFWREALRVSKPGAHLLAFGGTRTFHRLTCAIEDAGWEIRDCIMWVYGSGFPKSLDVSKAIDKAAGAEREVIGSWKPTGTARPSKGGGSHSAAKTTSDCGYDPDNEARVNITAPATDLARQWQGWGTALKPAVEYVVCARKPLTLSGLCGIMALNIGDALCQLQSSVKDAGGTSSVNPKEFGAEFGSALWIAAGRCNAPDGLSALMDMLPSRSEGISCLSIASSWLNTLGAICQAENTFTTEMATSLTTDLRILNSFPLETIRDSIARAAINQHGTGSSASPVESILSGARAKLETTLTPFAPGLVTSPGGGSALRPDWFPIILARKPLDGTVASTVAKWGTGGLNVDGCRVGWSGAADAAAAAVGFAESRKNGTVRQSQSIGKESRGGENTYHPDKLSGRFPANLVHDGSEEACAGMWDAARFFYCAKASRGEREAGLREAHAAMRNDGRVTEIDNPYQRGKVLKNHHPTVKPISLMRWLVRLVTPPDGLVLDPFTGSGTTGCAAVLEGKRFVGCELSAEYADIARARIAHHAAQGVLELEGEV